MIWYHERSARAAEAFVAELERAIAAIATAPQRWPRSEEGVRRFPLLRFPFWVIYRETSDSIRIVAVAHARRRPGYWRARNF
ncbi:MAG: type II toxin-antitoxin system RelE/ParE family toxin [Acidobacteriia bacterium]|nr:type II toxin-antitoxin system RelE/ParE family toxin [Terriglobia bacterium]